MVKLNKILNFKNISTCDCKSEVSSAFLNDRASKPNEHSISNMAATLSIVTNPSLSTGRYGLNNEFILKITKRKYNNFHVRNS